MLSRIFRAAARSIVVNIIAASCLVLAQNSAGQAPAADTQNPATQGGWRRVSDPAPEPPAPRPLPPRGGLDAYGNPPDDARYVPASGQADRYAQAPPSADRSVPPQLTIKPGTYLTVRVNQVLSSDHNQPGDAFSATLAQPVVVDGVVVAQRGQTVGGRVSEAEKAGRVKGVSRLGIELTELGLVDGQQVPVRTQLISRSGPTSVGRDAGAIATTTAVGAAIGAAADWGRGAAIGAGAGAAAGIIGVLLTRGEPTIVHPEAVLTFRIEAPVTVVTDRAPLAFRYVGPADYPHPAELQTRIAPPPRPAYYPPYPYYGPYWGPYWSYWGPGYYSGFYLGPTVFIGRGYYHGYHGWRR